LDKLSSEISIVGNQNNFEGLWTATSNSQAVSQVQAVVSKLTNNHAVQVRSITPFSGNDFPLFNSVSVRVEGEGYLDQLMSFMIDIGHNSSALIIERTNIRRLTKVSDVSGQPAISFQLEILAPFNLSDGTIQ